MPTLKKISPEIFLRVTLPNLKKIACCTFFLLSFSCQNIKGDPYKVVATLGKTKSRKFSLVPSMCIGYTLNPSVLAVQVPGRQGNNFSPSFSLIAEALGEFSQDFLNFLPCDSNNKIVPLLISCCPCFYSIKK